MSLVVVEGASDDLILVTGAISEEFETYEYADTPNLLAFSDGTVLSVTYTNAGIWRIAQAAKGVAAVMITQAPENGEARYSDRAELDGPITWVVRGNAIATAFAVQSQ